MLKDRNTRQTRSGFTLLELLVVLSILAIIAGGLLVAYDNMDDMAAEGVAAHTLASLDSAVRSYVNVEGGLPNEFDSLIGADYPGADTPVTMTHNPTELKILVGKIQGYKTLPIRGLTQDEYDALASAGLTGLRYVDNKGNNPADPDPQTGGSVQLDVKDADGRAAYVGPLYHIDIPHRAFETPRPGSSEEDPMNRGRGFAAPLAVDSPILVWNANRSGGTGGYDNTKVGAAPDDTLILFGLGNDASCIGGQYGDAQLASAPVFGKRQNKWEYGRYFIVVNVGPSQTPKGAFSTARIQCVMNSHGDFVDEMITEYLGQKD